MVLPDGEYFFIFQRAQVTNCPPHQGDLRWRERARELHIRSGPSAHRKIRLHNCGAFQSRR